jgi:hypothetical protein
MAPRDGTPFVFGFAPDELRDVDYNRWGGVVAVVFGGGNLRMAEDLFEDEWVVADRFGHNDGVRVTERMSDQPLAKRIVSIPAASNTALNGLDRLSMNGNT